jgi:hypothetical protein
MTETKLNADDVKKHVHTLVGMEVSRAGKGAGSTISLELGKLTDEVLRSGRKSMFGEAHISVDWDWRIEKERVVKFGSSLQGSEIERGLRAPRSEGLERGVLGRIPEFKVELLSGNTLRSMVIANGWPEWSLKLPDGKSPLPNPPECVAKIA